MNVTLLRALVGVQRNAMARMHSSSVLHQPFTRSAATLGSPTPLAARSATSALATMTRRHNFASDARSKSASASKVSRPAGDQQHTRRRVRLDNQSEAQPPRATTTTTSTTPPSAAAPSASTATAAPKKGDAKATTARDMAIKKVAKQTSSINDSVVVAANTPRGSSVGVERQGLPDEWVGFDEAKAALVHSLQVHDGRSATPTQLATVAQLVNEISLAAFQVLNLPVQQLVFEKLFFFVFCLCSQYKRFIIEKK